MMFEKRGLILPESRDNSLCLWTCVDNAHVGDLT